MNKLMLRQTKSGLRQEESQVASLLDGSEDRLDTIYYMVSSFKNFHLHGYPESYCNPKAEILKLN